MILSGSSLWGPLASVIAVGLISSMFFTLIVVPVLYVLVKSRIARPAAPVVTALIVMLALAAAPAHAASQKIDLPGAVGLALKQNTALKIAHARVLEKQQGVATARTDYLPQISTDATLGLLSDRELVSVPAGHWGTSRGWGRFPPRRCRSTRGRMSCCWATLRRLNRSPSF